MSTNEKEKRKTGRPAGFGTGKNPIVAVRLPKRELSLLDSFVQANGYSTRSAAMRDMIVIAAGKKRKSGQ